MPQQPFPEYLQPDRFAEEGRVLEGTVGNSAMGRLQDAVASTADETQARLEFAVDASRRKLVRGRANTEVELVCQRCLEPYRLPLTVDFTLALVGSEEEAERLPEEYDPLVYAGRPVRTAELIEDELILALPIVALHTAEDPDCRPAAGASEPDQDSETSGEAKPNPFDVLKQLKSRDSQ